MTTTPDSTPAASTEPKGAWIDESGNEAVVQSLDVMAKPRCVALAGNPNTGKTTVFNKLTGFRHRVGNYPGVTVEKRTGFIRQQGEAPPIEVVDLPGTYSLAAGARDEAIVLEVLLGHQPDFPQPDIIVCVVDANNIGRNLFLTTQILELGRPVVIALNMMDVAERNGVQVDVTAFAHDLGVSVVPIVANKGHGIPDLKESILKALGRGASSRCPDFPDCVCAELDGLCATLAENGQCPADAGSARAEALQTLLGPGGYHEARLIERCGRGFADELAERRQRIVDSGENVVEVEAKVRYAWIDRVLDRAVVRDATRRVSKTDRLDRVLTHPVSGVLVLAMIMGLCFQAIYTWAGPLMDTVDGLFGALGDWVTTLMSAGALRSLLVDGIIAGVGGILVFVPQILILFFFMALLEDCGYMARAAFLLDRWMRAFGLGGKCFIPLLSSFACAVPGIMATRTIDDRRERFTTMLIAPLMSCSARLPVYVLLIAAFVPPRPVLGSLLNLQAVTLLAMYVLGVAVAIPIAMILKKTVFKGLPQSFLMELPTYKRPSLRTAFHRMYEQGSAFVVNAGTVIFFVSILVWALAYYPRPASIATGFDAQRQDVNAAYDAALDGISTDLMPGVDASSLASDPAVADAITDIEALERDFAGGEGDSEGDGSDFDATLAATMKERGAAGLAALAIRRAAAERDEQWLRIGRLQEGEYLRGSFLGSMGRFIEPAVKPLGWDWRIAVAALASFPAREIVVATMGTIYNLGSGEDESSVGLREKLQAATWPDGTPVFNFAVALSIMVFFALCCQCAATLAVIKRETNSWRWPLATFTYMTALAYVGAALTYQIASAIG